MFLRLRIKYELKKALPLLALCFAIFHAPANSQSVLSNINVKKATFWKIEKSSYLSINGTTNINRFNCLLESPTIVDTLSANINEAGSTLFFINKELVIDINEFDCQSRFVTNDFRETLKAQNHPKIKLRFESINISTDGDNASFCDGIIQITLAGKTKSYNISYDDFSEENGLWMLKGAKQINLKDFDLEPPSRVMNLIKVQDEITVHFNLKLKQVAEAN